MDEYLSPALIAEKLNSSRKFVYDLIASGELPATRPSARMTRVSKADFEAFLARRSAPAPDAA
jgi:excisionase family DNA binding protein